MRRRRRQVLESFESPSPLWSQVLWCLVKESFSLIVRHSLVFGGRVPLVLLVVLVRVLYHYPYPYCPLLLFIVLYCPFIVHCCPLLHFIVHYYSLLSLYCPLLSLDCLFDIYIVLNCPSYSHIALDCPIFSLIALTVVLYFPSSFLFVPIRSHLLSILCPILYYPLSIDPIIDIYSLVPFLVLYYPLS